MLYWFILWREFKLSISEIYNIFPENNFLYFSKEILILEEKNKEKILEFAPKIWWTIKIIELEEIENENNFLEKIENFPKKIWKKFHYSINIFPQNNSLLKNFLTKSKKIFKQKNISARFVNKTNSNLSSAQILGNNLLKKWWDFNFIKIEKKFFFWKTIYVQDIESYSKRDFWKNRDMQVGMLPVKLSQIMINLSREKNKNIKNIYDPFVWLATILIEWILMWIKKIFWSDFSVKMVETSIKNLEQLKKQSKSFEYKIFEFDAKDMQENDLLKKENITNIVSEGFLWEIMTKKNISIDRINIQRKNLKKLYEKFFSWLQKQNFSWIIVISFPFWELEKKYIFFEEIYEILNKYCEVLDLLPKNIKFTTTKTWSLLYKRPSQLVWREIFKLKIKI